MAELIKPIELEGRRALIELERGLESDLSAVNIFPRGVSGEIQNFGFRVSHIPESSRARLNPEELCKLDPEIALDYLNDTLWPTSVSDLNLIHPVSVEPYRRGCEDEEVSFRSHLGSKLVGNELGSVWVSTEPLGSFFDWIDQKVNGSLTTVNRFFEGQSPTAMLISLRTHDQYLSREIQLVQNGKTRDPINHYLYTNEYDRRDALLATNRAIMLFAGGGPASVAKFLKLSLKEQIEQSKEPEDFLTDFVAITLPRDLRTANEIKKIVATNRLKGLTIRSAPEVADIVHGRKLNHAPHLPRLPFMLKVAETTDSHSSPFLVRHKSKNGPIHISLSSEPCSPGVRFRRPDDIWRFLRSEVEVKKLYHALVTPNIPAQAKGIEELLSRGFVLDNIPNATDIAPIEDVAKWVTAIVKDGGSLNYRLPYHKIELMDAAMNFLQRRQTIVITNGRTAEKDFHRMSLALDAEGRGTAQVKSKFGMVLVFSLPQFKDGGESREFLKELVHTFDSQPWKVVDDLFRHGSFMPEQSLWMPHGREKWAYTTDSSRYQVHPDSARTFHYLAGFYHENFSRKHKLSLSPFSKLFEGIHSHLPSSATIRMTNQHGVAIDLNFSQKGLTGITLKMKRNSIAELTNVFGSKKSDIDFPLSPSDQFQLGRALGVVERLAPYFSSLTRKQLHSITHQPIWRYLQKLQNQYVG